MQDGRTVKYHPELHKIVGMDRRCKERKIPENLKEKEVNMVITQTIHLVDLKEMLRLISILTCKQEWKRKEGTFYLSGEIDIQINGAEHVTITLFSKDYSQSLPEGFDIKREECTV